jgi:NADH-quinone oxidoreductase subunit M
MAGGIVSWAAGKRNTTLARIVSLVTVLVNLLIVIWIIAQGNNASGEWIIEYRAVWISTFGIEFHLALDGLSLLMLLLTYFIGSLAVLVSWKEITVNTGFFHFNLLWILAGITGIFLSLDLFVFYFFWEVMLIPMYFLIGIWGHENRIYASYKFFIFTQASGLLMFLAILGLYMVHASETGTYTFDYLQLIGTPMTSAMEFFLMLGFLAAFLVKLPAVPFHSWLPDAHTEAPTAGSLILAALMLKTGAYGLLRFIVPLFPQAAEKFAPVAMILGVAGILYGAKLAFAQTDFKRLVAYTSVNHMGFIVIGVFALNQLAWQGVVMQIIAHGISTGALFIIAGQLSERLHTRDLSKMGGLWNQVPSMAGIGLVFVMASLGLPGLGNFIAEFLTLAGMFRSSILFTCLASIGLVFATVYSIRIMQKVFYGPQQPFLHPMKDLSLRESLVLGSLVIVIFFLGLFPQPVMKISAGTIDKMLKTKEVNAEKKSTIQESNALIYDSN